LADRSICFAKTINNVRTMNAPHPKFLRRNIFVFAFSIVLVAGLFLYTRSLRTNPPGFFIDESSIAYNAYSISQTGRDEFGVAWPLYFRAFGEYKNPVYVYLVAAVFRLTGPNILSARLLSAIAGLLTAILIGLLCARITGKRSVGLFVMFSALLTPWLFELSRVVLEVSLYPLAVTLFLLCVHHASQKSKWSWGETVPLALSLALLTYTYSIGRLLAPLLALGLIFFAQRAGWKSIAWVWALYALTLTPLGIFNLRHPGALTARFSLITYLNAEHSLAHSVLDFLRHYAANISPWRLLVTGDPNNFQMAHLYGAELMLAATVLLSIIGACFVLRSRRDVFWLFICYALIVSIIPASLTAETFHMLHLSPAPIFLLVLAAPAVDWLLRDTRSRAFLGVLAALTLLQGASFQMRYDGSSTSEQRSHIFDAGYPQVIFDAAVANGRRPIYLSDAYGIPGYIQAYWYATLHRVPLSDFVHLPIEATPPPDALTITTKDICADCDILAENPPYTLYLARRSSRHRNPLPDSGFHAEIKIAHPPVRLAPGEKATLIISIKNISDVSWKGRDWHADPYQIAAGNHWLDSQGEIVINDDGRAPLTRDLPPGESIEIPLTINAPSQSGNFQLEIDMLQEGVSWFGLKGSATVRLPITIR
jgi:4-amino-4-deoxy-L-arabinose transferase-like glycosyltransferase